MVYDVQRRAGGRVTGADVGGGGGGGGVLDPENLDGSNEELSTGRGSGLVVRAIPLVTVGCRWRGVGKAVSDRVAADLASRDVEDANVVRDWA